MSFVPVPCRSKQNEMIKFLLFAITIRNSFGTEKTFEITYPSNLPQAMIEWIENSFMSAIYSLNVIIFKFPFFLLCL